MEFLVQCLNKIPIPGLKTTTLISILLISYSAFDAVNNVRNLNEKLSVFDLIDKVKPEALRNTSSFLSNSVSQVIDVWSNNFIFQVLLYMLNDPFGIWSVTCVTILCLILFGKCVQTLFFGPIRVSEKQHLIDRLWNFSFLRSLFVFGIINVQSAEEIILWSYWFALIGFLLCFSQLSKDRFEYLTLSPSVPRFQHLKLFLLINCILILAFFTLTISCFLTMFVSLSKFAFMIFESLIVIFQISYTLLKYGVYLHYNYCEKNGIQTESHIEKKREKIMHYVNLSMEMIILHIDLVFHINLLMMCNIMFSIASFVIFVHLKNILIGIQKKWKKHRSYLFVLKYMEKNYQLASSKELEAFDNCAICWEKMRTARKLPCKHLFHEHCLQSWLERETSCPTCRLELVKSSNNSNRNFIINQNPRAHHFFHFNGSRFFPWLPSFSVELTRGEVMQTNRVENNSLDTMARQVQALFPQYPLSDIIEDLRITRSIEWTIDGILDGRLTLSSSSSSSDSDSTYINDSQSVTTFEVPSSPALHFDNISNEREFSNSAEEREKFLTQRKRNLLQSARNKYLRTQSSK